MSKKKLIILLVVVFISCSLVSFFFKNQKSQREDIKVKEQVNDLLKKVNRKFYI